MCLVALGRKSRFLGSAESADPRNDRGGGFFNTLLETLVNIVQVSFYSEVAVEAVQAVVEQGRNLTFIGKQRHGAGAQELGGVEEPELVH